MRLTTVGHVLTTNVQQSTHHQIVLPLHQLTIPTYTINVQEVVHSSAQSHVNAFEIVFRWARATTRDNIDASIPRSIPSARRGPFITSFCRCLLQLQFGPRLNREAAAAAAAARLQQRPPGGRPIVNSCYVRSHPALFNICFNDSVSG